MNGFAHRLAAGFCVVFVCALYAHSAAAEEASVTKSVGGDEEGDEADEGGGDEKLIPFDVGLSIRNNVGFSEANELYVVGISADLGYKIPVVDVNTTLGFGGSKELTNADSTTKLREWLWADTSLGLSRSIYTIPVVNIKTKYSMGFQLPTSRASQTQTLRLGWSNAVSVSKAMYGFTLSFKESFKKNFHEYTTAEIKPSEDVGADTLSAQYPYGLLERVGALTNTGRTNTSYSFSHTFGLSYAFTPEVTASAALVVANGRSYKVDHENTTAQTDATGEPLEITNGPADSNERGPRDSWGSDFSISYGPSDYFSFQIGVETMVPQLDTTAKGYYNPFWVVNYDNMTTGYFALAASY